MNLQASSAPRTPRPFRAARAGSLPRVLAAGCTLVAIVLPHLACAEELPCAAATVEEARALADRLLEAGRYQSAGECYEAAGEYARANQAFLDAVTAQSKAAERRLADQADSARKLARELERAFRGPPRGNE